MIFQLTKCLLSALSPEDIKYFFEPIIKRAVQICKTFTLINSSSDSFNQYSHPIITVSQILYGEIMIVIIIGCTGFS